MKKTFYTLFDNFEYPGYWWLPHDQDNKVPGKVTFNYYDGVKLSLSGSLLERNDFFKRGSKKPETIHGVSEDGKFFTLINSIRTQYSMHIPGTQKEEYDSELLILGQHFKSLDSIRINSCYFYFTYLEEWFGYGPVKLKRKKTRGKIKEISATFSPFSMFDFNIPSIGARVSSLYSFHSRGDGFTLLQWHTPAFINIVPYNVKNLRWYMEFSRNCKHLFALLIAEPVFPTRIVANIVKKRDDDNLSKREQIEIFFKQTNLKIRKSITANQMLLTFPLIKKNIVSIFDFWFCKKNKFEKVYDLLFGTLYNQTTYLEFNFLALMQALESYHRSCSYGKYVNDFKYNTIRRTLTKAIPKGTPSDLRDSLKARIKYGNEYSLRKRLKEIFRTISGDLIKLLCNDENRFIDTLVTTRNYLTHYDHELKGNALEGVDLYYANINLEKLLFIVLLKYIGLDDYLIRDAISESKKFSYSFILER